MVEIDPHLLDLPADIRQRVELVGVFLAQLIGLVGSVSEGSRQRDQAAKQFLAGLRARVEAHYDVAEGILVVRQRVAKLGELLGQHAHITGIALRIRQEIVAECLHGLVEHIQSARCIDHRAVKVGITYARCFQQV